MQLLVPLYNLWYVTHFLMKSSQNFHISIPKQLFATFRLCKLDVTFYILPARGCTVFHAIKQTIKRGLTYFQTARCMETHPAPDTQAMTLHLTLSLVYYTTLLVHGLSADRQPTTPGTKDLREAWSQSWTPSALAVRPGQTPRAACLLCCQGLRQYQTSPAQAPCFL